MSKAKHGLDRYILMAFLHQVSRVFGVQVHLALRSDGSDVVEKITDRSSDRTTGLCLVRPTGFSMRKDGYRTNSLSRRGLKSSVSNTAERNGEEIPSEYNIVHPVAINTEYEVIFTVNSYTEVMQLWALWVQTSTNNAINFKVQYEDLPIDIHVILGEEFAVPEKGARGQDREDMMRVQGSLTVQGYTTVVSDPHVVPIILYPQVIV